MIWIMEDIILRRRIGPNIRKCLQKIVDGHFTATVKVSGVTT